MQIDVGQQLLHSFLQCGTASQRNVNKVFLSSWRTIEKPFQRTAKTSARLQSVYKATVVKDLKTHLLEKRSGYEKN